MGMPHYSALFSTGSAASPPASFYVPYKGVKKWSWETYWLVGGFFFLDHLPVFWRHPDPRTCVGVLQRASRRPTLGWTYLFRGALGHRRPDLRACDALSRHVPRHGRGARYCAALRHLLPPILKTVHARRFRWPNRSWRSLRARPGKSRLLGVVGLSGGHLDRRSCRRHQGEGNAGCGRRKKRSRVRLQKGHPGRHVLRHHERLFQLRSHCRQNRSAEASVAPGPTDSGPVCRSLIVVMFGGFTTNFIWCVAPQHQEPQSATNTSAIPINAIRRMARVSDSIETRHRCTLRGGGQAVVAAHSQTPRLRSRDAPRRRVRLRFAAAISSSPALAGTTWYFQFFFYSMGADGDGAKIRLRLVDPPHGEHHHLSARCGVGFSRSGRAPARRPTA